MRGGPVPAQHRHLVRLAHGAEHRVAGAASDVGRDADTDRMIPVPGAAQVEQARSQEGVRGRAVHDRRSGRRQARALARRQMDAVREQAAGADQTEAVVDIGVVLRPGKVPRHQRDLRPALREVRVHVAIGMARGEVAGGGELRLAGGDRKAHRDRIAEPPAAVPALDQLLAVAHPGGRVVAQRRRRVAVHHGLAGHDRHRARLRGREQRLGRAAVDGGEDHGGGRTVLYQPIQEHLGRRPRVGGRAVALLLGIGESPQPVEQVGARRGQHAVLREVDVGVDEARQHQRRAVVVGRHRAEPIGQVGRRPAPGDPSV